MVQPSMTLQNKFENLEERLALENIERRPEIKTMVLALVAPGGVHHFQLGPPGVAKSRLIDTLISHIGGLGEGDTFKTLLTKFSTMDELFGPLDVPALKVGHYKRIQDLTMAVARVAFVDEIWKGSSSILNSLLWLANERQVKNDGHIFSAPLRSLFCASNEMPEGAELNAIFDRIHFRHLLEKIREQGNFIQMLQLDMLTPVGAIVDWSDIELASAEAAKVVISDDVYQALNKVRNELAAKEITPSDRRFKDSIKIIQASAFMRGDTHADLEDLTQLAHVLWDHPKQAQTVETLLLNLSSPLEKEAQDLLTDIQKLDQRLTELSNDSSIDNHVRQQTAIEIHTKAAKAKTDLQRLRKAVKDGNKKSVRVEQCRELLARLTERLLEDLFDIDDLKDDDLTS